MSYTTVDLGGEKRGLKFGAQAFFDFARVTGQEPATATVKLEFEHVSAIAYCGLLSNALRKREDFLTTLDEVRDWVDDLPLSEFSRIYTEFTLTYISSEDKKKEVAEKAQTTNP